MGLQFRAATKGIRRKGLGSDVAFESDRAGTLKLKHKSILHSCVSGLITETLTGAIPAKAKVVAVTARVVTVLTGAALGTWSLGSAADLDLYAAGKAKAKGTVVESADYTADPEGVWSASARDLLITGSAGIFTTGTVRVEIWYFDASAPLS